MTQTITAADFAPFRTETAGCLCAAHCLPITHLISLDSGRNNGGTEHRAMAARLLAALRGGTHERRTEAEYRASVPAHDGLGFTRVKIEM